MKRSKLQLMTLCGVLLIGILAGCSSNEANDSGTSNDASNEELEVSTVYKQNCLACHGDQLQGGVGPNLQEVGSRLSQEDIAQLIYDGQGTMPAFGDKLSDEEINELAQWLSEQK